MTDFSFWTHLECIDLSVPLSEEFPLNWPSLPAFRKGILNWFEDIRQPNGEIIRSRGYYYDQYLAFDEHTGTHVDFPIHVLPPRDLESVEQRYGKSIQLMNFVGPAIVIDARSYLDQSNVGVSPRIALSVLEEWEMENGEIDPSRIALINTGYIDKYFRAFPEGNHLLHDPVVNGSVPGWPVPSDELLHGLAHRGVRHVGISSPSMGALDDGHGPHRTGIELGITYAEFLIRLDRLPPLGTIYVGLPLNIAGQSGSPIRAVGLVPRNST
jgi:kynurenine formamidase